MREKIKRLVDIVQHNIIYIIIILIAFASFGLGRLSVQSPSVPNAITVETFQVPTASAELMQVKVNEQINISAGTLVASVNGTKYHYPWCSGAQRIKEDNKIWFTDIENARESGYAPAANCKGLK